MVQDNAKLEREREFHDRRFTNDSERQQKVGKFYKITKSIQQEKEKMLLNNSKGAKVIEYGCATGSYAFKLAECGAELVTGKPGFNTILKCLELLDSVLLKLPFIKKQAWLVLIELSKPIK